MEDRSCLWIGIGGWSVEGRGRVPAGSIGRDGMEVARIGVLVTAMEVVLSRCYIQPGCMPDDWGDTWGTLVLMAGLDAAKGVPRCL